MKKHFKFFIALIALVSMFTVTAYAKATPFNISKDDGNQYITDNTKDRTDNVWLITISTSTPPSYTDWWPFTPNVDVVGYRVRKYAGWGVSSTAMSNYHTFTNYVTNYQLPYTTTPYSKQKLALWARLDSASNRNYEEIYVNGKWFT